MALTSGMISQLESELRDVALIWLVTIAHADLAAPIRLTSDYQQTVSRSNTYTPYPQMEVGFPDDAEDRPPRQSILLDNVGGEVIEALRSLPQTSPPTITIELVLGNALDTVQDSWTGEIREASYDLGAIEAEVRTDDLLGTGAPALSYTPALFPAMFASPT